MSNSTLKISVLDTATSYKVQHRQYSTERKLFRNSWAWLMLMLPAPLEDCQHVSRKENKKALFLAFWHTHVAPCVCTEPHHTHSWTHSWAAAKYHEPGVLNLVRVGKGDLMHRAGNKGSNSFKKLSWLSSGIYKLSLRFVPVSMKCLYLRELPNVCLLHLCWKSVWPDRSRIV